MLGGCALRRFPLQRLMWGSGFQFQEELGAGTSVEGKSLAGIARMCALRAMKFIFAPITSCSASKIIAIGREFEKDLHLVPFGYRVCTAILSLEEPLVDTLPGSLLV